MNSVPLRTQRWKAAHIVRNSSRLVGGRLKRFGHMKIFRQSFD
ncbi:MAG: hypothetical protein WCA21_20925 [Terracidiphilus sp.]